MDDANMRRELADLMNSNPQTKEELIAAFGADDVWDTEELKAAFDVRGFLAPFCHVVRKSDGKEGIVGFQHWPRFYFKFVTAD